MCKQMTRNNTEDIFTRMSREENRRQKCYKLNKDKKNIGTIELPAHLPLVSYMEERSNVRYGANMEN